jgi:hypothetical protein
MGTYPQSTSVEAGEGLILSPEGEGGRWLYGPDGEVLDSGTKEMGMPGGTWLYTSANTVDGLRNDGPDQASILGIELVPTTEQRIHRNLEARGGGSWTAPHARRWRGRG